MRVLGIDYGKKRIGLALSDPEGRLGFPHSTVATIEEIIQVAERENVGAIVIGLTTHPEGNQHLTEVVKTFAAELAARVQLPVVFEDEMFTTKLAERHTRPARADAAAAALILQSYLDRQAS
jgi:putative Holliday junction resolvase